MKKNYAESSIFIVNCRLQPTEFDVNTFTENFCSTYGVKKKNVLFMTPEIIKSKMELAAFRKRMLRKLGKLKVVKKENIKIKEYDVERRYLKELLILKASEGNKIFTELFAIKKLLMHTSGDLKNLQVDSKNTKTEMGVLNKQIKEYKEKKLKLETKLHQIRETIKNTTDKLLLEQKNKDTLVQKLIKNKGSREKNYVSELKSIKKQKKKLQKKLASYKDKLKEYENKKAQLLDDQKSIRNEIGILKYKKSDISQKISSSEKKKQQLDNKLTELNKKISQLKTSSKLVEVEEAKKTFAFSTTYSEWNRRGVIKGLFTQFQAFRRINNAEISFRGRYDLIDIEIMYKDKYGKEYQANKYPINVNDLVQDTTKIKNEFWKQEWHIEKHKEIYGDVIVYKYAIDNSGTSGGYVNLRVT
ncbi:MAG: hypothetical protein PVG30_09280 [Gammaproteobacteria bacterium]